MKRNPLTISLLFLIFISVFTSLGCVEVKQQDASAPPAPQERFTVTFSGEVGDQGWVQVMHDNKLNTTIYRCADGYGYQGIAVISDKDLRNNYGE
ncbi:MAG: hypothetical protein PHN69_06215 [Candidatus Pacebacteria bacterium]|nr:hypothetical protein [Candidatus Paceibacterota bacterium]